MDYSWENYKQFKIEANDSPQVWEYRRGEKCVDEICDVGMEKYLAWRVGQVRQGNVRETIRGYY